MTIKYSQLELAGNLYYPVAIISSAAILLIALGIFIYLTNTALTTSAHSLTDASAPTDTASWTNPNAATIFYSQARST